MEEQWVLASRCTFLSNEIVCNKQLHPGSARYSKDMLPRQQHAFEPVETYEVGPAKKLVLGAARSSTSNQKASNQKALGSQESDDRCLFVPL